MHHRGYGPLRCDRPDLCHEWRRVSAVRPDAARPAEVGVGPVAGDLAGATHVRRGAARRGRPAQRRRPLPLLDGIDGDRRRPRHPPARLPRRDRELAARLQHRHDRPLRQRVPRRRGAHRRQPALEPARRDGHRPLPARAPPRDASPALAAWAAAHDGGLPLLGIDNLPGSVPLETYDAAAAVRASSSARRGPGLSERGPRGLRRRRSRSRSSARPGRSTPSAAAAIAMHAWVRRHATPDLSGDVAAPGRGRRAARSRGAGEWPRAVTDVPGSAATHGRGRAADAAVDRARGVSHAHRHPRGLRRDARRGQGAAPSPTRPSTSRPRRPSTPRSRASPTPGQRRHHPGLDRRRGVPLRPDRQEHGHRLGRVRGVRRTRSPRTTRSTSRCTPTTAPRTSSTASSGRCSTSPPSGWRAARQPLFQSHMWDGSAVPLDENLEIAEELLAKLPQAPTSSSRSRSASSAARRTASSARSTRSSTRTPEDALATVEALGLGENGRYMTALTFGNVHGVYKPGNVKLRPEILKSAQEAVVEKLGLRRRRQAVRPGLPRRLRLAARGDRAPPSTTAWSR